MSSDGVVHVAMLPSAGLSHLSSFLRLATFLVQNNIKLTLIIPQPTYILPQELQLISRFNSSFPQVNLLHFDVLEPSSSSITHKDAHYFAKIEAIQSSAARALPAILSSLSPPLSFFVSGFSVMSSLLPVTKSLSLPYYVLITSCATFFTFLTHFSALSSSLPSLESVEIPGIPPIPISSVPSLILSPNSIFKKIFMENSPVVNKVDGFFINTFDALEHQQLEALNSGKVLSEMPPVFPLGPFMPCDFEKGLGDQWKKPLMWLDDQPSGSVVFANFGNSTRFGWDQIREIADGLVRSECRFLLVVKDNNKKEESSLEEVLGDELVERVRGKGLVMKEWVFQSGILSHEAVGGFFSHCGWNSIVEAALNGVPIFGWPQSGDHRMNAQVLESGWGTWKKDWGWFGERSVSGEEIGDAIKVFMNDETFKTKATQIKEAARNGDREVILHKLIQRWNKNGQNL